jgi:predicted nucleic acid-binding protein
LWFRATARSHGPARRLLQIIAEHESYRLALSPYIIAEVGKALSYSRLQHVLRITPEEIEQHLAWLRKIGRFVEPELGVPVVLTDPNDDPIIYTAVGAGANVLCARDRAFFQPNAIAFCRRYNIEIMDELRLLREIG